MCVTSVCVSCQCVCVFVSVVVFCLSHVMAATGFGILLKFSPPHSREITKKRNSNFQILSFYHLHIMLNSISFYMLLL